MFDAFHLIFWNVFARDVMSSFSFAFIILCSPVVTWIFSVFRSSIFLRFPIEIEALKKTIRYYFCVISRYSKEKLRNIHTEIMNDYRYVMIYFNKNSLNIWFFFCYSIDVIYCEVMFVSIVSHFSSKKLIPYTIIYANVYHIFYQKYSLYRGYFIRLTNW